MHLTASFILVIAECTMQGGHKNLTLQQMCKDPAPEFFCGFCERSSWNEKNIKKRRFHPSPCCIEELIFIPSSSKYLHTLRSVYLIPLILVVTSTELMQKKASVRLWASRQMLAALKEEWLWETCILLIRLPVRNPTLTNGSLWHKSLWLDWSMYVWIYLWTFLTRWTKDMAP